MSRLFFVVNFASKLLLGMRLARILGGTGDGLGFLVSFDRKMPESGSSVAIYCLICLRYGDDVMTRSALFITLSVIFLGVENQSVAFMLLYLLMGVR